MQNNQTNTNTKKVVIKYTDGECDEFIVVDWYCTDEKIIYLEREGKIFAAIPIRNIFKIVEVANLPSETLEKLRKQLASSYMPVQPIVQQ